MCAWCDILCVQEGRGPLKAPRYAEFFFLNTPKQKKDALTQQVSPSEEVNQLKRQLEKLEKKKNEEIKTLKAKIYELENQLKTPNTNTTTVETLCLKKLINYLKIETRR